MAAAMPTAAHDDTIDPTADAITVAPKPVAVPGDTRAADRKAGTALVRRAIRHGLVPEFKPGVPFKEQTTSTQWALHILATMSKDGKVDIREVKHVIEQTADLVR